MNADHLTERLLRLSPAKRALLELKLNENVSAAAARRIIPAHERHSPAPLSFSQQRLWFLNQLEPESSNYNQPRAIRLSGPLDEKALHKALDQLVARHEALRTTFVSVDGEPLQVIAASHSIDLPIVDLRGLAESDRNAETQRQLTETIKRPFDLSKDLMLRALLLRLAAHNHILVLVTHHIASDGWSSSILWRELGKLYEEFSRGEPNPLPELPVQYADYAIWQRGRLQGQFLDDLVSYWKKQLAGIPSVLDLTPDRPRPAVQSHRGESQSFVLSRRLSEALKAFSRQQAVTLYMILLAAFNVLLYRMTGQRDLVIGSPIAGRNRPEIEGLIGFFVNTLVLRTRLSDDFTFKRLLDHVRTVTLEAFAHQELPFEKLVEVLQPKRDLTRRSLVQVAFALQNVPREQLRMGNLTVGTVLTDPGTAKLDLTLFMRETDGTLTGSVNYAADLFDGRTIGCMIEHFRALLEALVEDPERPLDNLPALAGYPISDKAASPLAISGAGEASNLTRNQLLVWAGQKLCPEVPLYNMPFAFYISGEIDPNHFQKAFQTLLNSSDALRTVMREANGIPQQIVLPTLTYQIEFRDFSGLPDAGPAVHGWLESRCKVPFKLDTALFDCALGKISREQFVWFLNIHHVIIDGRSFELIFHILADLYARSLTGNLQQKIELPAFQDYVAHEIKERGSPPSIEAHTYWKTKLAEPFEPVRFYGNCAVKKTTRTERIPCELGFERTRELKQLASSEEISAKTEHASIFNIFAALLSTYLYRVSGNRRQSIGTPFHNRRSKEFKETIGLLMEVLPLRILIEERDTFASLIRKIGREAATAFRFSHSIGNTSKNQVYDVLLNYNTASFHEFHGFPVKADRVHTGHENDSLAVRVRDYTGGGLVVDFEFHCDVFESHQRHRAVEHLLKLLDAFLEDPHQSLEQVDLLAEGERKLIVSGFNQTRAVFPEPHVLSRLFEAQARQTPDRPAILCEKQSLTFAELNSRANQAAHHLQSLGVGPETIVAICVEPSIEAIIGILAILKAGSAYLPLDPQYPMERLALMLEDARAAVLLTLSSTPGAKRMAQSADSTESRSRVPGPRSIVCLDTDWELIAQRSAENPACNVTADNLAYVIYTSGSTGRPKGVMVTHRGICNRLLWEREFYRFTQADRLLQKSSLAFDTSVLEIFRPLLCGAQMVIACPERRHDSAYLVKLMVEQKITVAEFVPSMLRVVLDEERVENCRHLSRVFSGGEALSKELQESFLSRLPCKLHNTYGPTEASVDVAHWECGRYGSQESVPIGRPVANTCFYILDSHLNLVPIGVAGELYIGGFGLARGYFKRPDLTAEQFIPNPFSDEGERLYKTGDLVRYLPDGNLEFLGRIDRQIKIRGFRMEPNEIESALCRHPAVREAIVLAREDLPGGKQLVAYVAAKPEAGAGSAELRSFLKKTLPDPMVPSSYVFLEALPRTPNGKLDHKALPAPNGTTQAIFVLPRSTTEKTLAAIWTKLLGVDRIGVRDDFFELGGHSLLAVRLFAEIEKEFKVRPPLASLFQNATLEHLAALVQEVPKTSSSLVPVQPAGSKPPFFCVHEFFGDVFCYRNLARCLGKDQPFYALQPRGLNGEEEPFADIQAMAAYYIETIRRVQPHGPYALGGLCVGGVIAFEMAQQLRAQGEAVALVALLDSGIRSNQRLLVRWWSFFRNLSADLPSWVEGSWQLTRSQWADLIRLKFTRGRVRWSHNASSSLVQKMGELFHFSERHQKVAYAQQAALRQYRPKPYPGRLTLFRARMQPFFSSHFPDKGWGRLAAGGLQIKSVPGNHAAMLQEPHVRVLAEQLTACLASARECAQAKRQVLAPGGK